MTSSRHIPADADLTYFTVTCHLAPIVADLSQDSDYDPNTARIDAVVTFTPKYKAGEVIHSHTSTPPTGFLALPVTALIDDGYLKLRAKPDVGAAPLPGTLHGLKAKIAADTGQELPVETDLRAALNYAPVRLLGNSATLEIEPEQPLYYDFSFTNIKIDGKQTNYVITGGTFEAPWEDTVVDLLDFMPLSPGPYAAPMVVGPQGPQGIQGIQGPATIAVGTTTTSVPGTDAAVSNSSGDPANMVLDFVIPRGDVGPQGIQGIQGEPSTIPGPVGPIGPPGAVIEHPTLQDFPATGEAGYVYMAVDRNLAYRWDGSKYMIIGARAIQTVTAQTTVGSQGDYIVLVGDGGAPVLPTAAGNTGRYTFENTSTQDKVVAATAPETIDGRPSVVITPGRGVEVFSNGANWFTVGLTTSEIENIIGDYEPETLALFDRMTVRPDTSHRTSINNLIKALKVGGIWERLDGFHVLAAHTAQAGLLNWVTGSRDLIAYNSPTFTPFSGFAGDGISSYVMSPSFAGSGLKMAQNDESLGAWVRKNPASTVNDVLLAENSGGSQSIRLFNSRSSAHIEKVLWRMNMATGATAGGPSHSEGWANNLFISLSRTATPLGSYQYANGALEDSNTSQATGTDPRTRTFWLSLNRTATSYAAREHSAVFYGRALDANQHAIFYNAVYDYMLGVGAVE